MTKKASKEVVIKDQNQKSKEVLGFKVFQSVRVDGKESTYITAENGIVISLEAKGVYVTGKTSVIFIPYTNIPYISFKK